MKRLHKFKIIFRTAGQENKTVYGLFRSSFDAYLSTLNYVGQLCYVKVMVL